MIILQYIIVVEIKVYIKYNISFDVLSKVTLSMAHIQEQLVTYLNTNMAETKQNSHDNYTISNDYEELHSPLEARRWPGKNEIFHQNTENRDELLQEGFWEHKYQDLQERFSEEVAKRVQHWKKKVLDHNNINLSKRCKSLEMEVAQLEDEKQELLTRIKDCELRIYDLFEDNQLMATKCESSNSTIQQLVVQNQSSVTSNEIKTKVLQEVLNNNKELQDIVTKLAATVSELEYANNHLEEKSRTLMQKYEKAEADIQKLDENFQKQVMILNQSLTQVQYLENRNEEVTKRYEISQRQVHQLQKLNKDLATTTESSAELVKLLYRNSQELVQKCETSEMQVQKLEEKCQSLDTMFQNSETQVKKLMNSNRELSLRCEISNTEIQQLKKMMKEMCILLL